MSEIQITITHTIDVEGDKCGKKCPPIKESMLINHKRVCWINELIELQWFNSGTGHKYKTGYIRCQACIDAERKAGELHAPSYDKGYDANKKDYEEVWADLGKAIEKTDKANELIRELDESLSSAYRQMNDMVDLRIEHVLAKTKEFLK